MQRDCIDCVFGVRRGAIRKRPVHGCRRFVVEQLDKRVLLSAVVNSVLADVNEDGSRGFLITDFQPGFYDSAGGELQDVKVTSLPADGSLSLGGTAVTANQVIPAGAVSTLLYTPTHGFSGSDSFGWNGTDGTGYAATPAAVDVTVSPLPHLSIAGSSLVKGTTGTSNMVFVVTRSGDINTAFTVNYNTVNGTAVAGTDYTATGGTLSFSSGQTTATIPVPVIGSALSEPNRTFTVQLSGASVPSEFPSTETAAVGSNPQAVVAADFRGDGKIDLAVANYNSDTISVLLGNGDGTFQPAVTYFADNIPAGIAVGDFNGDGKLDLVVTNEGSGDVSVLLGNGDGTFKPAVNCNAGYFPYGITVGDFAGNGKLDVAVTGATFYGSVSVLMGNGDGTFQAPATYNVGSYPYSIIAGDFAGNGKPDLAVASYNGNIVSVLANNGNGTFQPAVDYPVGSNPDGLAVGDFNGDGNLDLAVANYSSDNVSVLLGNGSGTFGSAVNYNVGNGPQAVIAGDFQSTGRSDLVTANGNDGTVSLLPGNGDGTFATAIAFNAGTNLSAVAAGDFNSDGRIDLASTDENGNGTVSTLLAHAPSVAVTASSATGTIISNQSNGQVLSLNGPAFYLKLDANPADLDIWTNSTGAGPFNQQVPLSTLNSVSILGTTGTDTVIADYSAGDPLPSGGLTDTGGGNGTHDTLQVIGSTGNDSVTASAGQILINGDANNFTNVGRLVFTPGVGTDFLSVMSGALTLAPPAAATGITPMTFSSISIGTGAQLAVAAPVTRATRSVVVTTGLTLPHSNAAWTGTLDLSGNDLIVHAGNLSTITGQIKSGFNPAAGGNWLGTGITSSAAAGDLTHLTALGAIQNSVDGTTSGAVLYSSGFDGVPTASTDVLVKYTYYGDADLSGKVDGSDYSRIDNGFTGQLTGWFNGDFNYDNAIDGTDYALIDNSFNTQGASLAAEIAPSMDAHASKMVIGTSQPFALTSTAPATDSNVEALLLKKDILDKLDAL